MAKRVDIGEKSNSRMMGSRKIFKLDKILTILVILILAHAGQADDWPMNRHDAARTGASGKAVEPPLELLWKYPIHDYLWESPIRHSFSFAASDGIIYVRSSDNNVSAIYALYGASGTLKWKYTTGNSLFSTPAVSGGMVYVGSWNNVYAFDAASGVLKWNYETRGSDDF